MIKVLDWNLQLTVGQDASSCTSRCSTPPTHISSSSITSLSQVPVDDLVETDNLDITISDVPSVRESSLSQFVRMMDGHLNQASLTLQVRSSSTCGNSHHSSNAVVHLATDQTLWRQ